MTTLLFPQAIRFMVDGLAGGETPISLNTGAILLVLLFLVQSAFAMLRTWLFAEPIGEIKKKPLQPHRAAAAKTSDDQR